MFVVVPGPLGLKTWQAPGGALGENEEELNTPNWKRAPRTTAIMSIAHPYVIKYSIADCDFLHLKDELIKTNIVPQLSIIT